MREVKKKRKQLPIFRCFYLNIFVACHTQRKGRKTAFPACAQQFDLDTLYPQTNKKPKKKKKKERVDQFNGDI